MKNEDRKDHEFFAQMSFTHGGVKVNAGERFIGKDKRFSNEDLNYLESKGKVIDFTNRKNIVVKKEEPKENVPIMENPFKEKETVKFEDEVKPVVFEKTFDDTSVEDEEVIFSSTDTVVEDVISTDNSTVIIEDKSEEDKTSKPNKPKRFGRNKK
jgi:hypothetical protein